MLAKTPDQTLDQHQAPPPFFCLASSLLLLIADPKPQPNPSPQTQEIQFIYFFLLMSGIKLGVDFFIN